MHQIYKIYFVIKRRMFRASSLPIIRSYLLYTRQFVRFMEVMWPLASRVSARKRTNCRVWVSPFHRPRRPLGRVEVYLYSIFDLGRNDWGVSVTPRPHLTHGKDPVPIVQEAGWASGPVWTGAENLAPTGIRSPDRPARRQPLYRLRYPAHSSCRVYSR